MNKNTRFALGLMLFGAFLGCSSSTTPTGTSSGTAKTPGAGSWFTDSINAGGAFSSTTFYVVSADTLYFGKSHAIVAIDTVFSTIDTIAYAYETNGDMSLFLPRAVGSWKRWFTLPFQTHTAISVSDTDIQGTIGSRTVATGIGSGSDVVNGTSLSTQFVRVTTTINQNGLAGLTTEDYHFAPSIGLLTIDSILADAVTPTTERKLVQYKLK